MRPIAAPEEKGISIAPEYVGAAESPLPARDFAAKTLSIFRMEVAAQGVSALLRLALAALLGPFQYGLLALLMLIPEYSEKLGRFGVDDAGVYWAGRGKYPVGQVAVHLTLMVLALAAAAVGLFLWQGAALEKLVFRGVPVPGAAVAMALLQVPAVFLLRSTSKLLIYLELVPAHNRLVFLPNLCGLALGLALAPRFGLAGVLAAVAGAHAAASAAGLVYLARRVPASPVLRPELVRDLFAYGVRLYVPAVVQYLHYRLDVLFVARFLSPREVGLYSLAVTLAELLRRVPGAVSPLLFPRVARLPDRQGMALTLSSCRHVSFLLILLALPFALGVGFVVTPLLGARYEGLRAPALALLPGIVAVGIVQLLILHFFARGRPGLVLGSVSVGLAANLALNLLWIPRWGILGAALASTASYGLCAALLVMVLLAREGARLRDVFVLRRGDWRVYADLWRRRSWRGAAAPGGREAA